MSDQFKKTLATAGVFFSPSIILPVSLGLLLLAPLVLPFIRLPTDVPMYDQLRIAMVLTVALIGFVSLTVHSPHWNALGAAVAILILAMLYMVAFGYVSLFNILELSLALLLLGAIPLLVPLVRNHLAIQTLSLLLSLFALSLFISAFFAWLPFCVFESRCRSLQSSFVGFENKRQVNDVQNLLVPVLLGVWLSARSVLLRIASLVAFGGMLWLGFLLDSRGLFVALIAAGIVACIVGRPRLRQIVPPILVSLSAFLFWWSVQAVAALRSQAAMASIRTGDSGRFELWIYSIKRLMAEPLKGYGPGAFAAEGNFVVSSPHNILLSVGYDYGVLVALLVGLAMAGLCRSILTVRRPPLAGAMAWGLLVLMVASMVSNPHITPLGQLFYVVAAAVTLATDNRLASWWQTRSGAVVNKPQLARFLGMVLWGGVCGLVAISMVATMPQSYDEPKRLKPRIWLDGEYAPTLTETGGLEP